MPSEVAGIRDEYTEAVVVGWGWRGSGSKEEGRR